MTKRIYLAGATGVIGRRLLPLLVDAGYTVGAMTRSSENATWLSLRSALSRSSATSSTVPVLRLPSSRSRLTWFCMN